MNVLIVGSGGREHALAWKVACSEKVKVVYVAPGNAGTERETKVQNLAISASDSDALITAGREKSIDIVIIGPEEPLANGLSDKLNHAGIACFGPSQKAAMIESSKSFSKAFMQRHGILTAEYAVFTEVKAAIAYIRQKGTPIVIKANGLAAGKGVVVATSQQSAETAIRNILVERQFGVAGQQLVIEEYLEGEEASFIVLSDGEHALPLASSQDHKPRDDSDQGPNTGGMGAYSPAPVVTPELHRRIMEKIISPTLEGLAKEGRKYIGFLYAGIMITPDGTPKVLEFNCRLGDPETQPIMMRLKSDLAELCNAAIEKRLNEMEIEWEEDHALGVVLAAKGYPENPIKGDLITGLDTQDSNHTKLFYAGVVKAGEALATDGGRVLCVTALGDDLLQAKNHAYERINSIRWDGMFYRTDIGNRSLV